MDLYPQPPSPRQRARDLVDRVRNRSKAIHVDSVPYLDEEALQVLKDGLDACSAYLEYGAGGSTVLAAQTGKAVFSVETHVEYAAAVREALPPGANVQITTVDIGTIRLWGVPVDVRPTRENVAKWAPYAQAPWRLVDEEGGPQPDLVLVDGRFRVASAMTSLGRLQGLPDARVMVDDYAMRPEYWVLEAVGELQGIHGRAAVFAPRPIDHDKLQAWLQEYRRDWR